MPDLDPEELGSLQPLHSLAMAAHWREQGLQMRMLTQMDPQTPLLGKWQTARVELIQRLPGSALAVIPASRWPNAGKRSWRSWNRIPRPKSCWMSCRPRSGPTPAWI